LQAIDLLRDQPASPAKAMAYSNMSQLKMLTDQPSLCVEWGEQAIAMARELNDHETLSHALNNVGSVKMNIQSSEQAGIGLLQQSLEIALNNSLHEHAARAFSNMGSNLVKLKNYEPAKKILEEGIKYCEERDLDLWRSNMLSLKASLFLETGEWTAAAEIAENLLKNENQLTSFSINALKVLATIKMRSGHDEVLSLLQEARAKAFETTELQRIVPTLIAMLEYEWLNGKEIIPAEDIDYTIERIPQLVYRFQNGEFAFWLLQAGKKQVIPAEPYPEYDLSTTARAEKSAAFWSKTGDPYMECLCLSKGTEEDKRKAIKIADRLGANTVCEKMKLEMRNAGIKKIPRGIRETTRANPHFLTGRELDVLKFLKEGLHNKEIATRLYISVKTVDQHIASMFFKLNVNSRARAVAEAIRQGIIE
jgi:DNA-binding CsgD family transcriptional regulator/tetratricopeptide (TPR) repeat protein